MTPTAGMKTSEFLLALVPIVLGIILTGVGLYTGQGELVTKGVVMLTGSSAGYSLSRGLTKMGTTPVNNPVPTSDEEAAKVLEGVQPVK